MGKHTGNKGQRSNYYVSPFRGLQKENERQQMNKYETAYQHVIQVAHPNNGLGVIGTNQETGGYQQRKDTAVSILKVCQNKPGKRIKHNGNKGMQRALQKVSGPNVISKNA